MKDVSIEYAHIYTNQQIADEHRVSLELLGEVKTEFSGKDLSFVIMVDDYSFPDPTFDYDEFSHWLTEHGNHPDIIINESMLIPVCDQVLEMITNEKLRADLNDYVVSKKYPCSLFIASWYLVRLGKIEVSFFLKELTAEKLVNILPKSFKPFEDRAIEIVNATPFQDQILNIENRYFEGRLI